VLPFYDGHGVRVLRVLTDHGAEYCGRVESHPYELFLHLSDIDHTKIRVRRPQTNGAVKRLNQIIQEEFYKVAFRKRLYRALEEIQADLDGFMTYYNVERTNQGGHCQGKTPLMTFIEGLELYQKYVYEYDMEQKEGIQ
jgi:hypothetical protein